ncbi:MAG: 4Fe-4S dicluster domain-containing protein [Acidimicrobiales bacterium]
MNAKYATRATAGPVDFGWRLGGRPTTVPTDHSFDLAAAQPDSSFLEPYCRDLAGLQSCLQCGICTATCDLAGDEGRFPRRQVTFVRLGLKDRLVADPDIWHCYSCTECSSRCPSGVNPAGIMSALRRFATERYAYPRVVARVVTSPRSFWLVYVGAASLLCGLVAATGAFNPGPGPLRYADMLPNQALVPFFSVFTILSIVAVVVGATRAWSAWYGSSLWAVRPRTFWRALKLATTESLAHRRFFACKERRLKPWAHGAVLYGFLGLLIVSVALALLVLTGRPYPIPMADPFKVLGNVSGALLIGGTSYFLLLRIVDSLEGRASTVFDWSFLWNVLLVALTGVGAEALRVTNARALGYPVYFVHLVLVFVLIVTLPYTKLAHGVYRLLAVAGQHYERLVGEERACEPRRAAHDLSLPTRTAAPLVAPENFVELGHRELAAYSDAELSAAYYELRDATEPRAQGKYYPNIKRIFGTPFEREKDRREVKALLSGSSTPEWQDWYEEAAERPCTWWIENHLVARHALSPCTSCGMCTSVCPAAEYYEEYDPRCIVDVALSGNEERLVELLQSDFLWYCVQCGSCNSRCPMEIDIMSLITSLRCLAQIKGYHLKSVRGRQQYAGRHLWGANLWNRACSLYFRNGDPIDHPDFGPRYARWQAELEDQFVRLGAQPDTDGTFAGRKVAPATLDELRSCIRGGGTLFLWNKIEEHAARDAEMLELDLDQYYEKVRTEG